MAKFSKYKELISLIKQEFKIDFYGDHGLEHWQRVYDNTQKLAQHYKVASDVFELFALLHDSKREDELFDEKHGPRAAAYVKQLLNDEVIKLDKKDEQRLLYACANHTVTDETNLLFQDVVVQICFDSDRLDIGRVGIEPEASYMATDFAKKLVEISNK